MSHTQSKKNLELAKMALQTKQQEGTDTREHNLVKRYEVDPKSRAKAISAMCFSCHGGDRVTMPDHGYKEEIRHCRIDCPLKAFRPYK